MEVFFCNRLKMLFCEMAQKKLHNKSMRNNDMNKWWNQSTSKKVVKKKLFTFYNSIGVSFLKNFKTHLISLFSYTNMSWQHQTTLKKYKMSYEESCCVCFVSFNLRQKLRKKDVKPWESLQIAELTYIKKEKKKKKVILST